MVYWLNYTPGPKCMKTEEGEKYDNYLTKLQNICTENVGDESKPLSDQIKPNLSLPVLPTPT